MKEYPGIMTENQGGITDTPYVIENLKDYWEYYAYWEDKDRKFNLVQEMVKISGGDKGDNVIEGYSLYLKDNKYSFICFIPHYIDFCCQKEILDRAMAVTNVKRKS